MSFIKLPTIDKLLEHILAYSKEKVLKVISIFLWVSILFISFNKFVSKLDYKTLTSAEKASTYFLDGKYTLIIAWFLCIVTLYAILKYIVTILLPPSAAFTKLFLKYLIPEEYKISVMNVYYKTVEASSEHIKKTFEFWDGETVDANLKEKDKLDLLFGIILKITLILLMVINNFHKIEYVIMLASLIICLLLILFIVFSITSIVGKNRIYESIKQFEEMQPD